MVDLESLCSRLGTQTLDQRGLIIPESARAEAIHQALERMNAFLGSDYTLTGLDGAVSTTLPD